MNKFGFVYGIADPSTMETVYIGETTQSILRRLHFHCVAAFDRKNEFHDWIMKFILDGKQPIVYLIETIEMEDNRRISKRKRWEAEQFWIQRYRSMGCSLFNKASGNGGATRGTKMSDKQKKILSKRRSEFLNDNPGASEESLKKARKVRWEQNFPLKVADKDEARKRSEAAKRAWQTRRANTDTETI